MQRALLARRRFGRCLAVNRRLAGDGPPQQDLGELLINWPLSPLDMPPAEVSDRNRSDSES